MLRASDFLLTIAALLLLSAALESRARRGLINLASASQQNRGQASSRQELSAPNQRQAHEKSLDELMSKVKKNLDSNSIGVRTVMMPNQQQTTSSKSGPNVSKKSANHQETYKFYANQTDQNQQINYKSEMAIAMNRGQQSHFKPAFKVKVDFLRSSSSGQARDNGKDQKRSNQLDGQLQPQTTTASDGDDGHRYRQATNDTGGSLYLLSYGMMPRRAAAALASDMNTKNDHLNPVVDHASSAPHDELENEIDTGEQQQAPPFALFPPGQAQQQLAALQQQQQQQQQQMSPQLRQVLSNYQRYPQAEQLREQLARRVVVEPRPELVLRPPVPNQGTSAGAQQQQPFSPLQFLAGPLQAFLPGLTASPAPAPQVAGAAPGSGAQITRQPAAGTLGTGTGDNAGAQPQLPNPFAFLLQQQQPAPGRPAGPTPTPTSGQMPSLQDLYQRLPLYQALLAARQRQEALEAARKMQEQQRQQQFGQTGVGNGRGPSQPQRSLQQPAAGLDGPLSLPPQPRPVAGSPPAGNGAQLVGHQPAQVGVSSWPPAQPMGAQFGSGHQQPQQHGPSQPPNRGQNQVQFDDDNESNDQANGSNGAQHNSGGPVRQDDARKQQHDQNEQGPHDSVNNSNNNNNNNEQGNHHSDEPNNQDGQQDGGANEQDSPNSGGGNSVDGKPAEEEDPDLRQFQNLANSGDSFTDLFPTGILSNHDIDEIKTQQKEQAKKQEEEERQKHLQQQRQQQQQQLEQPNNRFGQPEQTGGQPPGQGNAGEPSDANANGDAQEDNPSGGEGEDSGGNDDGGQQEGGESDDSQQDDESPSAAALTVAGKSQETAATGQGRVRTTTGVNERATKSPGVEYASRKA